MADSDSLDSGKISPECLASLEQLSIQDMLKPLEDETGFDGGASSQVADIMEVSADESAAIIEVNAGEDIVEALKRYLWDSGVSRLEIMGFDGAFIRAVSYEKSNWFCRREGRFNLLSLSGDICRERDDGSVISMRLSILVSEQNASDSFGGMVTGPVYVDDSLTVHVALVP